MLLGLIKWFDNDKGFGTVGTSKEGDFFLHINSFLTKPEHLEKGKAVIFNKSIDKKNRNTAINCKVVANYDDFTIILQSLKDKDSILIEKEIKGSSYHGNPYVRKENISVSVKIMAISQLFKTLDSQTIKQFIITYFDKGLDKKDFIEYCEFIEERIIKNVSNDSKTILLEEIFADFKTKITDSILFSVWKIKKFKYISYLDQEDYQIPIEVLNEFSEEITLQDLKRIFDYEYGAEFCENISVKRINSKFEHTVEELKALLPFLDFIKSEKRDVETKKIVARLTTAYQLQIKNKTDLLKEIRTRQDFDIYNQLKHFIGNEIDEGNRHKLSQEIDNIIISRCEEEFKTELWIIGLIDKIPYKIIETNFLTKDENKINILKKLRLFEQLELLKANSGNNNFENSYNLIWRYLKLENSLPDNFQLSQKIFDSDFLIDKTGYELLASYNNYVENTATDAEKYNLFFKGLYNGISLQMALSNVASLNVNNLRQLCRRYPVNQIFIFNLLKKKIFLTNQESELGELCSLAEQFLDKSQFEKFDSCLINELNPKYYFKLWEDKKVYNFPKTYVFSIFNDSISDYEKIYNWLKINIISKEILVQFFLDYLHENILVTDRIIFYRQLNYIQSLTSIEAECVKSIKQIKNDFYDVILWFIGKSEYLNFDVLATKFIYFHPDAQVKIIRKLFFLKAKGSLKLNIDELDKLTRIDLDLYKTNLSFNPDIPFDISSEIIIKALKNYSETNKFLIEGQLLFLVLGSMNSDKRRKFKLTNYFEKCIGRQTVDFNWNSNGRITKVPFGEKFYFAISFLYNPTLIEEVKKISGRKWNDTEKVWGIPSKNEDEVLEFAKNNHFYLDFEGSNYANNTHLANFKRVEIPNGISYCEGRLANKQDEIFKKDFWWCTNQKCYQKCETLHTVENWEDYTLLDFCEILELNTDEINRMGDFISKGHYYQFISLINRFNRLLEKLYCEECKEILYPVDHSHFAAYSVVRFCCENSKCGQHKKEVYLNHCLNGQCNSIVDSRIAQRCDNGLLICDNCGSCCSHSMLQRRLSNLQTTGGYIHAKLIRCVKLKLGHLERGEYFCYKCGDEMEEIKPDIFSCSNCNIKYDTAKYKIKRPHKYLPKISSNNGQDDFTI